MKTRSFRTASCAAVCMILLSLCTTHAPVAPIESVRGNCVGRVVDASGAPVTGASLLLVPEGFAPLSGEQQTGGIDSTISDGFGRFGFSVGSAGVYNLLAKSGNLRAMRQPIHVGVDRRIVLDDEIMREAGSLSGTVRLKGRTDHRSAVVLFLGTNLYATPIDSGGAFFVPRLAQGAYTLRLLAIDTGFAVVETTVSVVSGEKTALPCVELPERFVPKVKSLSAAYDPAMMRVTLTWPALDTATIANYAIYCNRSRNLKPVAVASRSAATYLVDLVTPSAETLSYQISAVGKDGVEGPAAGAAAVVKPALASSELSPGVLPEGWPNNMRFIIDSKRNFILFSSFNNNHTITVLDSGGSPLRELTLPSNSLTWGIFWNWQIFFTDTAGGIYTLMRSYDVTDFSVSIVKFPSGRTTPDIVTIRHCNPDYRYSMAVSAKGSVLLYAANRWGASGAGDTTFAWKFNPAFDLVATDTIMEIRHIANSTAFADSVVCFMPDAAASSLTCSRVFYFSGDFDSIHASAAFSLADFQGLSASVPQGYSLPVAVYMGFKGIFAFLYFPNGTGGEDLPLIMFVNEKKQPIGRIPFYYGSDLAFDYDGNCWVIGDQPLIKYPTAHLFTEHTK